jgi:Raf kinase inhibitor-like YbhB/YbcL family protein
MLLISPAFSPGGEIPIQNTHEGVDASPPLAWSDIPPGTRSFALVMDDPDAPDANAAKRRPWVHWVLVDLAPETRSLPEGVTNLPGGRTGFNDWGNASWDGPLPPVGMHRYRFKLYALDRALGLERPTKAELEAAMKDHVLDEAQLVGRYRRQHNETAAPI